MVNFANAIAVRYKVDTPQCLGLTQADAQCRHKQLPGTNFCPIHKPKDRYYDYLPERFKEGYQEALNDPNLLSLRKNIAVNDLMIQNLMLGWDTAPPPIAFKRAQKAARKLNQAIDQLP